MDNTAVTADGRAQSSVMSVVLLIGMITVGSGGVLLMGNQAITETRSDADIQQAETTMAQFDRQASLVGVGESGSRTVSFARVDGDATVQEDAGWIRVRHINYSNGNTETIYNRTLGAVVYENGGTNVAYQGGGVFRGNGHGSGSVLVSPPELHYQRKTLTLPVLRTQGDVGSIDGSTVRVSPAVQDAPVYPSNETYNATGDSYRNPVGGGRVHVTVQSDYYEAWAEYFRTQTDGDVESVNHNRKTVTLSLTANGMLGPFQMPRAGNDVRLRGLNDSHSVDQFELTLRPDEDAANFANLEWSLQESTAEQSFEISLVSDGGKPCNGGEVDSTIRYEDADGNEHVWRANDAFVENGSDSAFSYSCDGTPTLSVNLTGAESFEYVSGPSSVDFDHDADEPETFTHGDSTEVDQLVNHYLALFGSSVDLTVSDKGNGNARSSSGSVSESASSGTLDYGQSEVVTYLHITDNAVNVTRAD
ncbi:hypothetical protein HWV23_07785 [Natronomonas halophila]|uniref:DUF7289 family protein n=1 Tax=Natronomonas halophila TaxID=2747817 RepID=UPI0015B61D60|nr:hypothetical protein [Natronomonas halophila]QLD85629.1 hypothetical protein HWV23_07785 [Natronomonas halophila]